MKKILGIDLGKFKSVVCVYRPATTSAHFQTLVTHVDELREFLRHEQPDLVVFEACTPAGWLADLCDELGLRYQVANTTARLGSGGTSPARPTATMP